MMVPDACSVGECDTGYSVLGSHGPLPNVVTIFKVGGGYC